MNAKVTAKFLYQLHAVQASQLIIQFFMVKNLLLQEILSASCYPKYCNNCFQSQITDAYQDDSSFKVTHFHRCYEECYFLVWIAFGELSLNCECCLCNGLHLCSLLSQAFGQPYVASVAVPYLSLSVCTGCFCFTALSVLVYGSLLCHLFSPSREVPCLAEKLRQSQPKLSVHGFFFFLFPKLLFIVNRKQQSKD